MNFRGKVGTAVVDGRLSPADFDFTTADRWHVLVLDDGLPVARLDFPSPGATEGSALAAATLARHADHEQIRTQLTDALSRRLGCPDPKPPPSRTVSVVVCTHGRPDYLPDLFASLRQLDPVPLEVIIVDNAPGDNDCRAEVEANGFRYVREDRKGLDNARNTGLRVAIGEIVAFTDDDCVLPPVWLDGLDSLFEHEGVAAVTGPAFPYLLDTPSRVRMEKQASLTRGLRRIPFDFQEVSPLHASGTGVGANMAIRRDCLLAMGAEPYPPELDAGTESESGGDMFLLGQLLLAGWRVIYDPKTFIFHRHRPDPAALRRAVFGYGVGLSAALTKYLVESGELTAGRPWWWLPKQYLHTQRRRLVGRADAVETQLSWEYLRGGFFGALRWRRALGTQRAAAAAQRRRPEAPLPTSVAEIENSSSREVTGRATGELGDLRLTVVIPTFRRPDALRRCLEALAAQDVLPGTFDVLVVDDDELHTAPTSVEAAAYPFEIRVEGHPGKGSAAARNYGAQEARGDVLLFIDDDIVAGPALVRRHLEWHQQHEAGGVLVGPALPRPVTTNLVSAAARLWWQDFFRLLSHSTAVTFVGALTGNTSIRRRLWEEVGGLSPDYADARREDWEWGLRVLGAGVPLAFDPDAWSSHEYSLESEQRLNAARQEGRGDTLIAASHPEAAYNLPLAELRPAGFRHPLRWLGLRLWKFDPPRQAVFKVLKLLELGKFREPWMRLFRLAQKTSYAQGVYEAGWRPGRRKYRVREPIVSVELLSDEPIPPPGAIAPALRITAAGVEVARVYPFEGIWGPSLAEQMVDAIPHTAVLRTAVTKGWVQDRPEEHSHAADTEVIFGPASSYDDLEHRAELEQLGASVIVCSGSPSSHWEAIAEAISRGKCPLIAIPLPGTRPGPAWLNDALCGFDGERVGLIYGGFTEEGVPAEPIYLHDRASTDFAHALVDQPPTYLAFRRTLGVEPLGRRYIPVLAAVRRALDDGWVVAHRNARGMKAPLFDEFDRGEAFGWLEGAEVANLRGRERRVAVARAGLIGVLSLGWTIRKGRGRLSSKDRRLTVAISRGAAAGLRSG